MASSLQRLLLQAQRLLSLGTADEILGASCREALALGGGDRAFASCCLPRQAWEHGVHLETDRAAHRVATPAARSALFAIHRRVAAQGGAIELARSDDAAAIFAGLGCGADVAVISAVPIVHRTGRIWGELVLLGPAPEGAAELAQLATLGLENAQRVTFARRDQDRLQLLAEATDDALYDWDLDTRVFWWGGGILKLIGGDTDSVEPTARWKHGRIHPADRTRVIASFEAARDGHAARWEHEYRFSRHDGTYRHVEDRAYFLRDASGRAYRMLGSMRDVTALKALLVREQEARAEAERANRAKDGFLAILGHELRNPLAPIITGLELLRSRGQIDPERDVPVLQRQAQHLIRLVDDLLDISRIAHGKIELQRERLELVDVVTTAVETVSPLIAARRHRLTIDVACDGLEVEIDRARMVQAIANLLTNAAKYTEPGGQIAIVAARAGDEVAITVRDSGIGIAPDMLPHVFRMFVQEHQDLDRSRGGLGLGLSIVKNLIELHGGRVEARSEGRGRGSELTLTIPAAPPRPATAARSAQDAEVRAPGRRIMVVDDNEDAAELLSALLEERGNTTRVAYDADRALALADEFHPDLAVLDIGLPVMDGYELARRLRAGAPAQPLRLIALTGYGQPSDRDRALDAGFDAHLVKPITIDTLEAVIARLTGT